MAEKRRCVNCGKDMEQQFIGLEHCECGMSWLKGTGYFQRTYDMVFALETRTVRKGKNAGTTKQVPVINCDETLEDEQELPCIACKGDRAKVDGCTPCYFSQDGKKRFPRVKVGDAGDIYEGGGADSRCTDCGAKYGHSHHFGCKHEACPACGSQPKSCGCVLYTTPY